MIYVNYFTHGNKIVYVPDFFTIRLIILLAQKKMIAFHLKQKLEQGTTQVNSFLSRMREWWGGGRKEASLLH